MLVNVLLPLVASLLARSGAAEDPASCQAAGGEPSFLGQEAEELAIDLLQRRLNLSAASEEDAPMRCAKGKLSGRFCCGNVCANCGGRSCAAGGAPKQQCCTSHITKKCTTLDGPPPCYYPEGYKNPDKKKQDKNDTCHDDTCRVWGDPHVSGFDNSQHEHPAYLSLLGVGACKGRPNRVDVNMYGGGDFWLVRSPEVLVQGRFVFSKEFKPDRAAVGALAVGGPLLGGKLLAIEPMSGRVTWDGQSLGEAPLSANTTSGSLHLSSHKGPRGSRILEVQLPKRVHMRVVRFGKFLDAMIKLPAGVGKGCDGLCGNRNGKAEDDTAKHVAERMHGLTVHPDERLLPTNRGPHAQPGADR